MMSLRAIESVLFLRLGIQVSSPNSLVITGIPTGSTSPEQQPAVVGSHRGLLLPASSPASTRGLQNPQRRGKKPGLLRNTAAILPSGFLAFSFSQSQNFLKFPQSPTQVPSFFKPLYGLKRPKKIIKPCDAFTH
ncbi:hypothetical protein AVEN_133698-1 [Araneus ventricosus]|uniref:Uncharacterized protein n=1 Tax=Araneus ventricosus TaxID=182803 RepID=A0A4Y2B6S2_ARAVE|nr:hypothetical protein AVEN_133698-1 [Araneus ventricosus]